MEDVLPGLTSALNVHPVFVHFPIAFLVAALLFSCLSLWGRRESVVAAGRWMLYLGTLGAVVAVLSGFMATSEMGHDTPGHDLVHTHRNFMIVATVLALLTTAVTFAWRKNTAPIPRFVQLALLVVTVTVVGLGADRGALLVYRYSIGTRGETPPASHHHDHGSGTHKHDHK